MSEQTVTRDHAVGDTVSVWMEYGTPRGWYEGRVAHVYPHYSGGDTWVEVRGDKPAPFVTTCRDTSAVPVEG